jgi:hypothetical protein
MSDDSAKTGIVKAKANLRREGRHDGASGVFAGCGVRRWKREPIAPDGYPTPDQRPSLKTSLQVSRQSLKTPEALCAGDLRRPPAGVGRHGILTREQGDRI